MSVPPTAGASADEEDLEFQRAIEASMSEMLQGSDAADVDAAISASLSANDLDEQAALLRAANQRLTQTAVPRAPAAGFGTGGKGCSGQQPVGSGGAAAWLHRCDRGLWALG